MPYLYENGTVDHLNPTAKPRRVAAAQPYALSDEMVLYSPRDEAAYVFNASARAMWELCDGTRTVSQISRELAEVASSNVADVQEDVVAALLRLSELHLVDISPPTSRSSA